MKSVNNFVYWTPRILSILFVCFLTLFSLDVISSELTFWQIIIGLLIHNIPTLILLITSIVSWKHEIVGGIVFILSGLLYLVLTFFNVLKNPFQWHMISLVLIISGPAFLIGVLFLINWFKKRK